MATVTITLSDLGDDRVDINAKYDPPVNFAADDQTPAQLLSKLLMHAAADSGQLISRHRHIREEEVANDEG